MHTYKRTYIQGATPSRLPLHPTSIKSHKQTPISKNVAPRDQQKHPQRNRKPTKTFLHQPEPSRAMLYNPVPLLPSQTTPLSPRSSQALIITPPTTSHCPTPPQTRPSPYYSPNCSIASASAASSSSRPSPLLLSAVPPRWDSYR
jgi:hypothetical protein